MKDSRIGKSMIQVNGKNNTVAAKAQIRVIKKGGISEVGLPTEVKKVPKNETARRMARTIMTWISDIESRKVKETRIATARFLHM